MTDKEVTVAASPGDEAAGDTTRLASWGWLGGSHAGADGSMPESVPAAGGARPGATPSGFAYKWQKEKEERACYCFPAEGTRTNLGRR